MEATVPHTWEVACTGTRPWYVHLLPSLTDLAFLLPLFLLFGMLPGTQILLADGDTGWHIRTGDWIWQHKAVPNVDIFSFSKPHQPWFAWEWAWDVLFATIHRFTGLSGVVFLNVVLLGLISALFFRLVRRVSDSDVMAVLFTLLGVCGTMIHWLARPHLISWICVLIFGHVILSAENGNRKRLYALPLVTLAWANLHGGFPIGIVLLATSAFGEVLSALLKGEQIWRRAWVNARPYALAGVGCLAASFVNPYTWHLHQHIYSYLRDSKLLDNIQEFQSIDFHHPSSIFFEGMLLVGVPAAFWSFRKGKIAAALTILLWAHLSLLSGRNTPIYVLLAAPWAAAMAVEYARSLSRVPCLRKASVTVSEICGEFRPIERIERWHVLSCAAVLWVGFALGSTRPGFEAQFSPKNFRLQAIPALESLKGSRVFTSDQWGDYLIYRFYPSQRVFLDGRSDFYGDDVVSEYQHIMSAQYDWETDLKRFAIDTVMVKPEAPLAAVLKESPRWKLLFDDGSVLIFRAQPVGKQAPAETRLSARVQSRAGKTLGVRGSFQVLGACNEVAEQRRRAADLPTGKEVPGCLNSAASSLKLEERRSL